MGANTLGVLPEGTPEFSMEAVKMCLTGPSHQIQRWEDLEREGDMHKISAHHQYSMSGVSNLQPRGWLQPTEKGLQWHLSRRLSSCVSTPHAAVGRSRGHGSSLYAAMDRSCGCGGS